MCEISILHFIGKQSALNTVLESNGESFRDLVHLGKDCKEDAINAGRKLIVDLYDSKRKHRVSP